MISNEQWILLADDGAFADMCASFGKTLPGKVILAWFREVEECDYSILVQAFMSLKLGDKFPTFGMFWAVYRPLDSSGKHKKKQYCGSCHDGRIHYLEFDPGIGEDREYIAFCGTCHPGHKHAMSPHTPGIRWTMEPKAWNKKKIEGEIDVRQQIADMRTKMFGKANPENEAARERNLKNYG